MVKLTKAEYHACWQERIEKEERAVVAGLELKDLQTSSQLLSTASEAGKDRQPGLQLLSSASDAGGSRLGSRLGGSKVAGGAAASAAGSALGGGADKSTFSCATESILSSHVSSASASTRKIELLRQQLQQEKQKRLSLELQLAHVGTLGTRDSNSKAIVAAKAFK